MNKVLLSEAWHSFCIEAWKTAGAPKELSPEQVYLSPISFDKAYYEYLSDKYRQIFDAIFGFFENETFLEQQRPLFQNAWKAHWNRTTTWKQLIPLYILLDAQQKKPGDFIDLGIAYTLGQSIPSVAVDCSLDDASASRANESLFGLSAVTQGTEHLHKVVQKHAWPKECTEIFLQYLDEMYERMWAEQASKFSLPIIGQDAVEDYLQDSRLLSSVFFGITIDWAGTMADAKYTSSYTRLSKLMRKVRQLNDEMLDVDEDILWGLATLPYIHCLTHVDTGPVMQQNIIRTWESLEKPEELRKLHTNRQGLLMQSKSMEACAGYSRTILLEASNLIMELFEPQHAFDVTLMLNIRLALLHRLEENNWMDNPETKLHQQML